VEQILVVPRADLLPRAGLHGFSREGLEAFLSTIAGRCFFVSRDAVENDPTVKQIIPYVVLRHRDRIFLVQRTRAGAEARLRGKFSIGIGGHITREDVSEAADPVEAGMTRELTEELDIPSGWRAHPVGVLNDDIEPVGRVHFGVVYLADVPTAGVRIREEDKLRGSFATLEEIRQVHARLETWSQFVVDGLDLMEA
jgi:predicted NUDIX family phosphoesterase